MNAWLPFAILVAASARLAILLPSFDSSESMAALLSPNGTFVSATRADDGVLLLTRADGSALKVIPYAPGQLFVWDPAAPVYVNAGLDGQPGVAGVDDDGNAVVDDRSELGATGSDDEMLTPDHPDHAAAVAGDVTSRLLSHGAMQRVTDHRVILGPTQIRIDAITPDNRLVSKIIDLVPDAGASPEKATQ